MNTGRQVLLAILLGCIVSNTAMARGVVYRGTGTVQKKVLGLKSEEAIKYITAVIDTSNEKAMRVGYKAVFPDGGEQKLAIVLNEATSVREDSVRRGEARLLVHSGSRYAGIFTSESGAWSEVDDADKGFHIEFTRENGSKLEIVSKEQHSPSTMGELVPDIKITINVNDVHPGFRDGLVFNWKITALLDFNALMRVNNTSADELDKELFSLGDELYTADELYQELKDQKLENLPDDILEAVLFP